MSRILIALQLMLLGVHSLDSQYSGLNDNNATYNGCIAACQRLADECSSMQTTFANTTQYDLEKADYWSSLQSDVSPQCFVEPETSEDVARIFKIIKESQCTFAVKSGGHAAFTGASNAPNGVTILLKRLNGLELSSDRKTTRMGTGNIWIDVYDYLTPKNLSVVGGRVTGIGVGGLTLGGGISFFSGRYGWACDGVREYELVTPEGDILGVNQESHPDLYLALRGGGSNFGIVTRMDFETFEQGDIWGGAVMYSYDKKEELVDGMYNFGLKQGEEDGDVDASVWTALGYISGSYFASTELVHARGIADAPVFGNFTKLENVSSTIKMRSLTDLARELNQSNPNGLRESYWTHTFLLTKEVMHACPEIWEEEVQSVKDVEGLLPILLYQPISTAVTRQFARNGGNALGVREEDGPLLLMQQSIWWTDKSKDAEVLAFAKRVVDRSVEKSKRLESWYRYIYQNYAAEEQKVFEGYGKEHLDRLRQVAKEVDPDGVMQKLRSGYFKVW